MVRHFPVLHFQVVHFQYPPKQNLRNQLIKLISLIFLNECRSKLPIMYNFIRHKDGNTRTNNNMTFVIGLALCELTIYTTFEQKIQKCVTTNTLQLILWSVSILYRFLSSSKASIYFLLSLSNAPFFDFGAEEIIHIAYVHIQIYIAPKIVRANLRRWHRMTRR